jgi:hypothetical protein
VRGRFQPALAHLADPVGLENAMQHSDLRSSWVA